MEGLDLFLNKEPTPRCLIDDPEDVESDSSSRLSLPFSEFAPLEEPAQDLHGQLAKFSQQFQATMKELNVNQSCSKNTHSSLMKKDSANHAELYCSSHPVPEPTESCMLKLEIPAELMPRSPDDDDEIGACHDSHVSSRDLSLQHGGFWSKLEQYTEFTLSVEQHEGEQAARCLLPPVPVSVREDALAKCAAWLEQHGPSQKDPPSPPSTPDVKQSSKNELLRSKWKREKNLLLALKPT